MQKAIKYPVLDGEGGSVDQYGFATCARGAKAIATRWFVDPIDYVYLTDGPVTLSDGTTVARGWVAVTKAA